MARAGEKACNRKHGMHLSSEYRTWTSIRFRNKGQICLEWGDFETFYRDMGPRPTAAGKRYRIIRRDSTKLYSAANCYWSDDPTNQGAVCHGMYKSLEYNSWNSMVSRCTQPNDPNYHHYGGRGIKIYPEWRDFAAFYRDMGPRPGRSFSLDRIDVNGDYCPGNCRWAPRSTQARNKRSNRQITLGGVTLCMLDWAMIARINPFLVGLAIDSGRTAEEALGFHAQCVEGFGI